MQRFKSWLLNARDKKKKHVRPALLEPLCTYMKTLCVVCGCILVAVRLIVVELCLGGTIQGHK